MPLDVEQPHTLLSLVVIPSTMLFRVWLGRLLPYSSHSIMPFPDPRSCNSSKTSLAPLSSTPSTTLQHTSSSKPQLQQQQQQCLPTAPGSLSPRLPTAAALSMTSSAQQKKLEPASPPLPSRASRCLHQRTNLHAIRTSPSPSSTLC
jgi:hypothetical protein